MLLFVYGSLMDMYLDQELLHHSVDFAPYTLYGYEKKNTGDKYYTITKSPGNKVDGDLLKISEEDLNKLDKYEAKYERKKIELRDKRIAYFYAKKAE